MQAHTPGRGYLIRVIRFVRQQNNGCIFRDVGKGLLQVVFILPDVIDADDIEQSITASNRGVSVDEHPGIASTLHSSGDNGGIGMKKNIVSENSKKSIGGAECL